MKILHINCNYIGTTLHQLMIEELERQGISNSVFVPTYDKNLSVIDVNNNVYISECFNKMDRISFYQKQKKIINAVEKMFDITSFDLLHAYTLFTDGNIAMELSQKYNIPYVVAVRNTDVNYFFKFRPYLIPKGLKIIENASAIFFLSHPYKRLVEKKYRLFNNKKINEKLLVIPNGIDDFWFKNLYRERDFDSVLTRFKKKELRLVYAGNIDKNKNVLKTIEAIDYLSDKGWKIKFDIVGKIKDTTVFGFIKSKENCIYHSPVKKEALIGFYRKSDIFVMPSHKETFGLVYAEAMTQGLPVIYTKGQGFDGQFEEGLVGYHVNDNDYMSIVEKIEKIVLKYPKISSNCVEWSGCFRWNDICKKYLDIYDVFGKKR